MTLANMHSLAVCSVDVACGCGRECINDFSALDGTVEVPALKNKLRWSVDTPEHSPPNQSLLSALKRPSRTGPRPSTL
jgi:hypothetical protein